MKFRNKLFFFILSINVATSSLIPLELSLTPYILTDDYNNNGKEDFFAFDNLSFPQTIYLCEFDNNQVIINWEYNLDNQNSSYIADVLMADFDNNNQKEIILLINDAPNENKFLIFKILNKNISIAPDNISKINNQKFQIFHAQKMYLVDWDDNKDFEFIIIQGSPNRKTLVCDFYNNKINVIESIANKFVEETFGPLLISSGDFNGDNILDIFILNNSIEPTGRFIYSNGQEEKLKKENLPRIKWLNPQSRDYNKDGIDDLLMISKDGNLISTISEYDLTLPIIEIESAHVNYDSLINIYIMSDFGELGTIKIEPLSYSILSSKIDSMDQSIKQKLSSTFLNNVAFVYDDKKPNELWYYALNNIQKPNYDIQKVYSRAPDKIINYGNKYEHNLEQDSLLYFVDFTSENMPDGMIFNLEKSLLEWTPNQNQLGFHEIIYKLKFRREEGLQLQNNDGKQKVVRQEKIIDNKYKYLIYVNDTPSFIEDTIKLVIVNEEKYDKDFSINDLNVDSNLKLSFIGDNYGAKLTLIAPSDSNDKIMDTTGIIKNVINQLIEDTTQSVINDKEATYKDTIETEFEGFIEEKIIQEEDPFKQKKLTESVEEFKQNEEDYQEKLKTHDKVIEEGKNKWVPKDTITVHQDTLIKKETNSLDILLDSSKVENYTIDEDNLILDSNYNIINSENIIKYNANITWTPNLEIGEYSLLVLVDDKYSKDTLTLLVSIHPSINLDNNTTEHTVSLNQLLLLDPININQKPSSMDYNYSIINGPENLYVDNKGSIRWVPLNTQSDYNNIEIQVSDGIASKNLVYNIYVNSPPVISSRLPDIFYINKGDTLKFNFQSFDINIDSEVYWKLVYGPDQMKLDELGNLIWPSRSSLGYNNYKIILSDGFDSTSFKGSIYVNSNPMIISIPDKIVTAGNVFEYKLEANDENRFSPLDSLLENKIIFSLIDFPEGMIIKEDSNVFWNTNNDQSGEYDIKVKAYDNVNEDIQTFTLLVNSNPEITSGDSVSIEIGDTLKFLIKAKDLNIDDNLVFSIDKNPSGMNINKTTGLIEWTPTLSQIGLHVVEVLVDDGYLKNNMMQKLKVFVFKKPILKTELPIEAFVGLEYKSFLVGEDMYGEKIESENSYSIQSSTVTDFSVSKFSHQFIWTPKEDDIGIQNIVIKITDSNGISSFINHKISVFKNPCMHCDDKEISPSDSLSK